MTEKSETQASMPTQQVDAKADTQETLRPLTSRRDFLRRVAIGGGLALGMGGLAAYIVDRSRTVVVVLPNGDAVEVPAGTTVDDTTNLLAELAALREALAQSDSERRSLAGQLAEAQGEIERLNEEQEGLLSLLSLFEALDAIDLDEILAAGFISLGAGLATARTVVGLLEEGVEGGLSAIKTLVDNFPSPQAGIIWLKGEVSALLLNLENLAEKIEQAIEPIEPFATLVTQFILDILSRLPFGFGRNAQSGLEAMQGIVTGLPLLAEGIVGDVMDPLEVWFGQDNQTNLLGTLVNPIEADLIPPANGAVDSVNALDETYQNDLLTPAQDAMDEREAIRAQIQQARTALNDRVLAKLERHTA